MALISNFNMGISWAPSAVFKRKFRFFVSIQNFAAPTSLLPIIPERASRPAITINELKAEHTTETIYYPGRPEWKPVQFTFFDYVPLSVGGNSNTPHPMWIWLNYYYNAFSGNMKSSYNDPVYNNPAPYLQSVNGQSQSRIKRNMLIHVFDGYGTEIERWAYANCYPTEIDFGDLDMNDQDVCRVTCTMRYDRAYCVVCNQNSPDLKLV
jgi:hypothetical protein